MHDGNSSTEVREGPFPRDAAMALTRERRAMGRDVRKVKEGSEWQ